MQRARQVGAPREAGLLQEAKQLEDLGPAAHDRHGVRPLFSEHGRRHPVEARQPDEAESGGHAPGIVALRGSPKGHRARAIDEEVHSEVLLLDKELEEEALQAGEGVPVDLAQVIAGHVVTKIGKLD